MRHLAVGLLLMVGMAAPHSAWADSPGSRNSSSFSLSATASDQLRALFRNLDLHLIAKANAAECKDEGEICKTNADCCSGLECSGDPQTTCRPEG
jgi:hypothetical protein